jgi:flagellar biosynthesis chaperone FliJ
MSDERRERLKRLMDLRAKELSHRVADLDSARSTETNAQQELEEAQTRKMAAIAERDDRAKRELTAADWSQAESWLANLAQRELVVEVQRQQAALAVLEARTRVAAAKTEQEKIQVLIRRAVDEARKLQSRNERKLDDELGARASLRKSHAG